MATILNAVFDENGYIQSYAIIGTVDGGINVAIEEDIDAECLIDKFSCYKFTDEMITVTIPKENTEEQTSPKSPIATLNSITENNEELNKEQEENNENEEEPVVEELVVNKLLFDESKYYIKHNKDMSRKLNKQYVPSQMQSMMSALKILLSKTAKTKELEDDQKLNISGLYDDWDYGSFEVGGYKKC